MFSANCFLEKLDFLPKMDQSPELSRRWRGIPKTGFSVASGRQIG
jgi:hypothetical protein